MSVAFSSTSALFAGDPDVKQSPAALAARFDEYKKSLNAAPNGADGTAQIVPGEGGIRLEKTVSPVEQFNRLLSQGAMEKALGGEQLASIRESLASVDSGLIQKDINLTSPIPTGLVPFDLEAPAKYLVPVQTPLRNKLPRKKGQGTSRRYKRVTGFSNAQTGTGLAQLHPGITDGTQTNFGPGAPGTPQPLIRGPKISYTGDDRQVAYQQFSLSDQVTWSAQWAGQGFEDVRQLSQTSVLYSSMLAEERMTIYGRGTIANGYSGPLAPTNGVSAGALPAEAGQVGLDAGNYYVWVAASSGFGTGVAVQAAGAPLAVAAGQVIAVAWWIPVPGAVNYQVYVGTEGGAGNARYYGTVGSTGTSILTQAEAGIVIQGPIPTTGATAPIVDTSSQPVGYDGILPIVLSADSGYRKNLNAHFSNTNPGVEFQTAFNTMYQTNLAEPDEILMNGSDRVQLSDLLKTATATGYRLMIDADGTQGRHLGEMVTGIQNEVLGKMVNLTVHPYMPQGIAPILTHQLPFPNSEVDSCWSYVNVQDYMGVQWPVVQFTYDFSSYWYGSFLCYAPAWQGVVYGIKPGGPAAP